MDKTDKAKDNEDRADADKAKDNEDRADKADKADKPVYVCVETCACACVCLRVPACANF